MPSVTPFELPMLSPSRKRKHDDDPSQVQVQLYGPPLVVSPFGNVSANYETRLRTTTSQPHEHANLLSAINNNERLIFPTPGRGPASSMLNMPRKMIPLPVNKRFRLVNNDDGHHPYLHNNSSYTHAHPEPPTPLPQYTWLGTGLRIGTANSQPLLSPCHICHRKPTKKSDLDSFADCLGCGQRSCFVCLRACRGWLTSTALIAAATEEEEQQQQQQQLPQKEEDDDSLSTSFTMQDVDDITPETPPPEETDRRQRKGGGPGSSWIGRGHRELICSRCCVERGPEGDVVCLGCLAGMEGA
ncbi:uncharacterized protein F4812DRAFT_59914 [Daldinia caldariorum]|uniref:uncharacterized protein n=1 Tax=Daldinia caldariorum TaxID=326644 RepID=UPI0020088919|nr:uncharacterized protein F4812DRAFT_59914 [Daldinia caldariorum]KAI1466631.1 hypothetical protein F4812DRAFT_59914 [Daldinia caldariorum]